MTEQELNEIKEAIKLEIEKTKKAIIGYEDMSQPISPENSIGRISRMDAINNKSVAEAALRKAKEKLSGLKYMEKQVGEPGFGLCARCKQPIPLKRLILMPQSQNCVRCAR
ncbi:MAG: TraR/DksA family transcriptional regulator [Bacteroidetes bacterium]|nr:TraR/DksA family transcriptional regulator [Bacteroidota bacterium]